MGLSVRQTTHSVPSAGKQYEYPAYFPVVRIVQIMIPPLYRESPGSAGSTTALSYAPWKQALPYVVASKVTLGPIAKKSEFNFRGFLLIP